MKALLISIRPQWVEKILNGIKKDEIRKGTAIGKAINKLIEEQGVAPMLIYCTKDKKYANLINRGGFLTGMVVARFNATVEEINAINLDKFTKDSCLTIRELEEYLWSNILSGTAIHINDLEIFDKPKELYEFKVAKPFVYTNGTKGTIYYPLTRAPQSWCYVEV